MPKFSKHTALQGLRAASLVLGAFILVACGDSPAGISSSGGGASSTTVGTGADGGTVQLGSGTGAGFNQGVLAAESTDVLSGETVVLTVNVVDGNNNAATDQFSISFSSNCVGEGLATFSSQTITTATGGGTTEYTALGCSGADTITATTTVGGDVLSATIDLSIEDDQVESLEFVSIENPQLQLAGLGGTEQTDVTFKLVGELGAPIINESIEFSLSKTQGGIRFAGTTVGENVTVESDQTGQVSVKVQSGTAATSFTVRAAWMSGSAGEISSQSDGIVISTGLPIESKFGVSWTPHNPSLAIERDGVEVSISIIASDTLGNDIPDGTTIKFNSPEFGNVDSSCTVTSGECTVTWRSAGDRPADLRATVIAFTDGVEDFNDINADGLFNPGTAETPVDDNEPFADENENGMHDSDPDAEFFVDVNNNGMRDAGFNGVWDNNIVLAKQIIIALPSDQVDADSLCSTGLLAGGLSIPAGDTVDFGTVVICDRLNNANPLPNGSTVGFTIEGDGLEVFGLLSETIGDELSPTSYPIQIRRDNGSTDAGELRLVITLPSGSTFTRTWSIESI